MDRNRHAGDCTAAQTASLSARRAWIEMIDYIIDYVNDAVALRKESVDRNTSCSPASLFDLVALRKESVDRNVRFSASLILLLCRSPQGERG